MSEQQRGGHNILSEVDVAWARSVSQEAEAVIARAHAAGISDEVARQYATDPGRFRSRTVRALGEGRVIWGDPDAPLLVPGSVGIACEDTRWQYLGADNRYVARAPDGTVTIVHQQLGWFPGRQRTTGLEWFIATIDAQTGQVTARLFTRSRPPMGEGDELLPAVERSISLNGAKNRVKTTLQPVDHAVQLYKERQEAQRRYESKAFAARFFARILSWFD